MLTKKQSRLRRSRQTRIRIAKNGAIRLSVFRSNVHIYANLISEDGSRVLATASTLEKEVRGRLSSATAGASVESAVIVGKRLAEKAKQLGVDRVAFDRSGYAYHGRVKALAEAARDAGLQF